MRAEVWKVLNIPRVAVFLKGFEIIASSQVRFFFSPSPVSSRKQKTRGREYTKPALWRPVSTQRLLRCWLFQVIYSCDFSPARESASANAVCLSEDAEMRCSYCRASEFMWRFHMLTNRRRSMMKRRRQPGCRSKT